MKLYRFKNNKIKWYKKINFLKVIIIFIITFAVFFLSFGFLSEFKDIDVNILRTSIISILIAIGTITSEIIDHKNVLFITKDNKLLYLDFYDERSLDYIFKANEKQSEEEVTEKIIKNIKKEEGINYGEVLEVLSTRNTKTRLIVKVKANTIEWKEKGLFFVFKLNLQSKIKEKKLIIRKDIDDFDELKEIINNYNKNN